MVSAIVSLTLRESPIQVPINFSSGVHNALGRRDVASAIQIVRPRESTAETQPKLQPRFLRLSAMISQYFMLDSSSLPVQPANVELKDSWTFLEEVCLNLHRFCVTQLVNKILVLADE
jgi:hypothetical protein